MKKIFFIFILGIFLENTFFIFSKETFALTPTLTINPTQSIKDNLKSRLIENIASKVAELKLVEKRGIVGKVTTVTNTQLTVTDILENTRFVDVDELTKFSNPNVKGSYGISDITKNTNLGILGLYNKESRRILARFINVISVPNTTIGIVTSVNRSDFSFNVLGDSNVKTTFDVENFTKTFSYTKTSGLIRSGFSQIKENYNIFVIGAENPKNPNRINANRIIFFPQIPVNPKTKTLNPPQK